MRTALIAALLLSFTACQSAPGPQPVNQTPAKPASGGGMSAPHAESAGAGQPSTSAPDQPLDDKVEQLKAAYDKNPSDASAKKALADATFENAQYYMYKSTLQPNQKYPKALALYREVVKLDPANSDAQESIDMIEGIYRQMGRPIPTS